MKNRHYTCLLYFISFVILATLAIQFFWHYKNYQAGKQQLSNEIQASFNNAIDAYFIEMGKRNTVTIYSSNEDGTFDTEGLDSIMEKLEFTISGITGFDSIDPAKSKSIHLFRGSLNDQNQKLKTTASNLPDSLKEKQMIVFSSMVFSINMDTIATALLNTYIKEQLAIKKIRVNYGYVFKHKEKTQKYHPGIIKTASFSTVSKSGYLPENSSFQIYFSNATSTILKRNLISILLSFVLIGSVVACLFWLLRIIRRQKQLAELKNDLISNITHEFKTPIATIGVALEGIQHFNPTNDPEKTQQYLSTSSVHLEKLGLMVEKLLETATLDGGDLRLKKEEIQVGEILENLLTKHQTLYPDKKFEFITSEKSLQITGDPFHLENAFNNILDNAVKYGGNTIKIVIKANNKQLGIVFQDSGNSLTKEQSTLLFDKFYRVPKGNTHDVKGFGIGLYYTKKIIEKHGGTLIVKLTDSTNFIVNLPYE